MIAARALTKYWIFVLTFFAIVLFTLTHSSLDGVANLNWPLGKSTQLQSSPTLDNSSVNNEKSSPTQDNSPVNDETLASHAPSPSTTPESVSGILDEFTPSLPNLPTKSIPDLPAATALAKAGFPDDYLHEEIDEDEYCKSLYSPKHLEYSATHRNQYCTTGSKSSLEIFKSPTGDEFAVADGVAFLEDRTFSMHCQLRNFTAEREADPENTSIKDLRNIEDIKAYFFDTGAGVQLRSWGIDLSRNDNGNACSADTTTNTYTLLLKRERHENVWHQLLELWQSANTIDVLHMAVDSNGKPLIPEHERDRVQVVFEDDDIGHLWELWHLVTGKAPTRLSDISPSCLGKVILPWPGSSSPFWQSHWEPKDCRESFMISAFQRRVFNYLGIKPKRRITEETVVTIIDRKGRRKIWGMDSYVTNLQKKDPEITFNLVDFAKISLIEQIKVATETDILVGTIGAGMTHILFLPQESSVAEFMPPNMVYMGFRNLAKMMGFTYFSAHGITEEEWNLQHGITSTKSEDDAEEKGWPWQTNEWVYTHEPAFFAMVEAAIHAQLVRGERMGDVVPSKLLEVAE